MAEAKGPLDGIRVLDLGRHQAGPRCAQVLARMGAEVIKLERLGGEETRYHAPWVRKQSAYWDQYNSGKKISILLKNENEMMDIPIRFMMIFIIILFNNTVKDYN